MRSVRQRLFNREYRSPEEAIIHQVEMKEAEKDVCLMEENPYRIHKAAQSNDMKVFGGLLEEDPTRKNLRNEKGWTPLHEAAFAGSDDVLLILFQNDIGQDIGGKNIQYSNVNVLTDAGHTALHLAVREGHTTIIELLMKHGADGTIKDPENLTPLHLAVQLLKHECMKSLLKDGKLNPDVTGYEFEMTPLHMSACLNDATAAKILLDNGAYLCKRSALGLNVFHYSAKHASNDVLNLAASLVEAKGYPRGVLLVAQDENGHSPLHCAIDSGKTEPVRVCLDAGAKISTTQKDGSTAVHLVCSQGANNIIQLMWERQPDLFLESLSIKDDNGMTPLHRAVLFNYPMVAQFLISKRSPLEISDCNGRTPLLLAASRLCWPCAEVLYKAGADMEARDNDLCNFIHLAIKSGVSLEDLWKSPLVQEKYKNMFNQTDKHGCTPIHYASKTGNLSSVCGLLQKGALITCKDNSKQSPLHFAARYGRVNTCRTLLDTAEGFFIINETNNDGQTALHQAAENGHVKVVALLMQRGALLHRDYQGNTPLHLAAKNGFTQTMKLLLNVHPFLLNFENNAGNTPLHEASIANKPKSVELLLSSSANVLLNKEAMSFLDIAIERGNVEATLSVVNHQRWNEIMVSPTKTHGTYMQGLIKYLPDVALAVLDKCIETSKHDPNSQDFSITYHFDIINSGPQNHDEVSAGKDGQKLQKRSTLMDMVHYGRVKCLSHPVCLQYIDIKWNKIGRWFSLLNIIFYLTFLICYTVFIVDVKPRSNIISDDNDTPFNTTADQRRGEYVDKVSSHFAEIVVVLIFIGIMIIKETGQIIASRWKYLLDFSNLLEWLIYISALIYILHCLLGIEADVPYNFGVTALFLAWVNLLSFIQRIQFAGIYIVMFQDVLKTLIRVVTIFSILIAAFGFTFYALLNDKGDKGYSNTSMSFLTTFVMMVGELNYLDSFVEADPTPEATRFSILKFLAITGFLLLMPILLMNLLVGLAIGDIESVQKNARLTQIAMQVEQTTEFEQKLPKFIISRFEYPSLTVYPNRCKAMFTKAIEKMFISSTETMEPEKNEMQQVIMQQKARLKELQKEMNAQTELLKLIVEKMQIQTETSDLDEGCRDEDLGISLILKQASSQSNPWNSQTFKGALTKVKAINQISKSTSAEKQDDIFDEIMALAAADKSN